MIKYIKNIPNLEYNTDLFYKNKVNILLITGLSGSGKSYIAKQIALKKKALIIEMDWLKHSKYADSYGKVLLASFILKYPEVETMMKLKFNQNKNELKNQVYIEYLNKWFDHIIANCNSKDNYIIEGIQLFMFINPESLKSYPIIIKGTSVVNALKNRFKRDFDDEEKRSLMTRLKFIKRVIKEAWTFQIKSRWMLNKFIKKLNNK